MKRDLELIRKILLTIENDEQPLTIPDESCARICYHVHLLIDRRFVEGKVAWGSDAGGLVPMSCFTTRMTMDGHDYLDSVRDPRVWEKTKSQLDKVGGGGPLELVKDIAAKIMAELIRSSWGG
jgi:Hypothetical protein (DUF2513)